MPYITSEVDAAYALDWSKWPVPEMPAIPKWDGPWNKLISTNVVDEARTAQLAKYNMPIKVGAGTQPWAGSTYGMPFTLYNDKGPKTKVWDLSKPITWNWFTPTFPIHNVALPHKVLREGDPVGSSDKHVYLIDPANKVFTEMILVHKTPANIFQTLFQTDWTASYSGGGQGVVRWDITKPYNAPTQPKTGVVATAVPQTPMIVRWDEIQSGRIEHCVFGVLPNYAKEFTGWARASDGNSPGHPVRGGEMLRLKGSRIKDYAMGTPERIIAQALHEYGWFQGDRNGPGSDVGVGTFPLTMDRRWTHGDGKIPGLKDMKLSLTDFEIVTQ